MYGYFIICPVEVNQKMAFFGFGMDFFRVFKFSLGYKLGIENPGFETLILAINNW